MWSFARRLRLNFSPFVPCVGGVGVFFPLYCEGNKDIKRMSGDVDLLSDRVRQHLQSCVKGCAKKIPDLVPRWAAFQLETLEAITTLPVSDEVRANLGKAQTYIYILCRGLRPTPHVGINTTPRFV